MDFVIIYVKPANSGINPSKILVVEKNRPEWQAGKYNLIGGKIEKGESPEEAATRELKEEAGMTSVTDPEVMGAITGDWGTVYCVKVCVLDKTIKPGPGETEVVSWEDWNIVKNSPKLIPNLRVVIPLLMTGIKDWAIFDDGPTWEEQSHGFKVFVNSDIK